ncbi:MAG: flagellar motor switch protein FliM [Porphyrobacter sp. IPPAS B-1204]|nr:MAG: flagellar motor switch protein FliM [Porphyrobacter sp. IPPAS B-1204]
MRMGHDFAPARGAALHCAELTTRGPRPEESAALLAAWRRDLARLLADDLSGLLSGDRLDVTISEPDRVSGADALRRIGQVAANSLLRVGALAETALLSVDFATSIALTDRSFGGDGRTTGSVPDALPRSAALLVEEAATMIAGAITRASYGDMPPPAGAVTRGEVIVRSESAARLKPFALDADVLVFTIDIANRQGCTWRASLAVAAERMARLLPGGGRAPRARSRRTPANGLAAPFAAVPLPLHVVLAEFDLSLARLQTLAPGDTIPLAMGRQVPLMVGDTVLAHGSVGTADDHMAIRLTRLPVSASHQGVAP